jgi:hypothetical protein
MNTRHLMFSTVVVFVAATARAADEVPLVKGDEAQQFELVGIGPDTLKVEGGEIRVSGKPNGYFATKDVYHNYVLTFEWKYDRPEELKSDAAFKGNSGLLVHVQKPHKVWPKSIEVQLANADAGHIFGIVGAKFQGKKDAAAQKRAIKPVGQWNLEEVTCHDGEISCKLNGILVDKGTGASPDSGQIGWQSEGGVIHFRNLKIKKLD